MKKNQLVDEPKNELVRMILKNQESMKVTLNGGKYQLDDATIPFQIGFTQEVADKKPTHILVLDITKKAFDEKGKRSVFDSISERTIFKMEPVHYLQLKEAGEHHLIFILLDNMTSEKRQWLLEKSYNGYENTVYFESIENLELGDQVAYCEAIVSVPEGLFAHKPETSFGKAIWSWVNAWYRLKPIDQCEYRKRKIVAFTIKPILLALGFLLRLLIALIYTTFSFVVRFSGFIFGYQPVSFFPNFKKTWWNFLVIYSGTEIDAIFNKDYWLGSVLIERQIKNKDSVDWYPQKTLFILGKRIHIPISLFALFAYSGLFFCYFLLLTGMYLEQSTCSPSSIFSSLSASLVVSLVVSFIISFILAGCIVYYLWPTITDNKKWMDKWNEYTADGEKRMRSLFYWLLFIFFGAAVVTYAASVISVTSAASTVLRINWADFKDLATNLVIAAIVVIVILVIIFILRRWIFPYIVKSKEKKLAEKLSAKELKKITAEEKQVNWLKTGFDINNMPDKIDLKTMPEPSVATHKLVINFWRTKAKVCKPYAKK